MNFLVTKNSPHAAVVLERLVLRHGYWPVLRAFLKVALQRRAALPPGALTVLNAHLRADIGLPPLPEPARHDPPGRYP